MINNINELEYEAHILQKKICNLDKHLEELELIIEKSSEPLVWEKAETRISKLIRKEAKLNRLFTEKAIAAFLARKSQAQSLSLCIELDESLLPSDVDDNDSEGASASFGFHKRTGNECQF